MDDDYVLIIRNRLTQAKDALVVASHGKGQHGAFSEPWHNAIAGCDEALEALGHLSNPAPAP